MISARATNKMAPQARFHKKAYWLYVNMEIKKCSPTTASPTAPSVSSEAADSANLVTASHVVSSPRLLDVNTLSARPAQPDLT